jgi:hypothetical protein
MAALRLRSGRFVALHAVKNARRYRHFSAFADDLRQIKAAMRSGAGCMAIAVDGC